MSWLIACLTKLPKSTYLCWKTVCVWPINLKHTFEQQLVFGKVFLKMLLKCNFLKSAFGKNYIFSSYFLPKAWPNISVIWDKQLSTSGLPKVWSNCLVSQNRLFIILSTVNFKHTRHTFFFFPHTLKVTILFL